MKKRIITMLLLVAMLVTTIAMSSCADNTTPGGTETDPPAGADTSNPSQSGDNTSQGGDDTQGGDAATEAPADTFDPYKSDLPEDVTFEGKTANILAWKTSDNEFFSETDSGETISSAIYWRNLDASERLKLEIVFNIIDGDSSHVDEYTKVLEAACMSADATYDLMAAYGRTTASCATAGLLQDIGELDYVDLDKMYYLQPSVEMGTIGDKVYFLTGDMSFSFLSRQSVVIFNNDLIQRYNLEDPYDLVLADKWTLDKLGEMSNGVYEDLNANGGRDEEDLYGIVGDKLQIDCTYYSAGFRWVTKDADNMPVISQDVYSEEVSKLVDKWISIFQNGGYVIKNDSVKEFESGNAIFWLYPTVGVTRGVLKESADFTFGIVPQPKRDASQEKYIGSTTNYYTLWGCPIAVQDTEISGALLEVLAEEGNKTIIPAVFEQAYKLKYNSDESGRQSQIFDILKTNVICDMGKAFSAQLASVPTNAYSSAIGGLYNNYLTVVKGSQRQIDRSFKKIVDAFSD